jgi:integrase
MSDNDNRAALTSTPRPIPSLEQVLHVIRSMPATTAIEQRNRALIAFTLLTGCRDRALVSLKLKHVDLENRSVNFDAREVKTKFRKSFTTFFMPVGDDVREIFETWVATLTTEHLWGPTDPLFPAPRMEIDSAGAFRAVGLQREHWTTANAVRRIFLDAFRAAGLPYFHPHSLRHTLGQLGLKISRSPEHLKAWSQNYGHESMLTTLMSYSKVPTDRQGEIMRELAAPEAPSQAELIDFVRKLVDEEVRVPGRGVGCGAAAFVGGRP